ncbi:hypothetical protein ACGFS9_29720 [Streptomyces sp. NPDC048566]|uniref:hypothetical protein n=1 Tax=Streptomyces sp. NPDC048566 TaxID=3365569 RepID=UPI0037209FFE
MTTPAPPRSAAPAPPRRRAPRGPSGLTWTVLRLHRTALLVWGAALLTGVAALAWMLVLGPEARAALLSCGPPGGARPDCPALSTGTAEGTYRTGTELIGTAVTYLAVPVAAWAGGALVGRELEDGTAGLAWTQSVGPARWLAAKLAVPAAALAAGTTVLVLLAVRVRRGGGPSLAGAWYAPDVYGSTGPVAVASVLAGLALGALAALVARRALPAAAAAALTVLALTSALRALRPRLWPARTVTGQAALALPPDVLEVGHGVVTVGGRRIDGDPPCLGRGTAAQVRDCAEHFGLSGFRAGYHPRSHFLPLQLVESGVLLAVTALATAAAFALLRRRTG